MSDQLGALGLPSGSLLVLSVLLAADVLRAAQPSRVCESIDLSARAVLLPARVSNVLSPLRRSHCFTQMKENWGRAAWMSAALALSPCFFLSPSPSLSLLRCQHCATVLTLLSLQPVCLSGYWAACYLTISFLSLHWFLCPCLSQYWSLTLCPC